MGEYNGDKGLSSKRDVLGYQEPLGPKYIYKPGPGLRGGENFGNQGSQGRKSLQAEGAGSPGALNKTILGDGLDQDDTGSL